MWEKVRLFNLIEQNFDKGNDVLYSKVSPTRCNVTQFIYFRKLLYMFRADPPPITRSTYNCIYSIWH